MKPIERKLLKHFAQLTKDQQQTLLQFAEFMVQKKHDAGIQDDEIPEPVLQERPETETVVGAIKRLSASYPMLDKDKLFNETSVLMTKHVMQGHEADQVIDELELVFERHYQELVKSSQDDSNS